MGVLQTDWGPSMKTLQTANKPVVLDQNFQPNGNHVRVDNHTIHLLFEEIIIAQHAAHVCFSQLMELKTLHDTDISHIYYSDGRQKLALSFEFQEHWFEVTQESLNPWGTFIECKITIDGIVVFCGLYEKYFERYKIKNVTEALQGRWINAFAEVSQILVDFKNDDGLGNKALP